MPTPILNQTEIRKHENWNSVQKEPVRLKQQSVLRPATIMLA